MTPSDVFKGIIPAGDLVPEPLQAAAWKNSIVVNGVEIHWNTETGQCSFRGLPVAMMWIDTTLAGLMSGVAAMVGPDRFMLALQAEGRRSVESDWLLIASFPDFHEGFKALNLNAAIAGWGDWQLLSYDAAKPECIFRAYNNWEGLYQRTLGVCWGSGMLAGKLSGICSKLFKTHCWATQTRFVAKGDLYDEFVVAPSSQSIEDEIEKLLLTDQATRADMAVALKKIQEREQQIQAANATLEKFTHIAAHHLQEPARRIVSFVQRLKSQLDGNSLSEEAKLSLDFIAQSALRQRALVHDIQLYLEAAQPRKPVQLEDVNSILQQVQERFFSQLKTSETIIVAEDLPPAFLDRPRLLDLFSLLIDNALCHGQPLIPDLPAQIVITGARAGNSSRYSVSDYGSGIPTEYHERVFEVFEHLAHNRTTGSGIGLAIARRIVESRHGKIWIENPPHPGTTVIFELPDGE